MANNDTNSNEINTSNEFDLDTIVNKCLEDINKALKDFPQEERSSIRGQIVTEIFHHGTLTSLNAMCAENTPEIGNFLDGLWTHTRKHILEALPKQSILAKGSGGAKII